MPVTTKCNICPPNLLFCVIGNWCLRACRQEAWRSTGWAVWAAKRGEQKARNRDDGQVHLFAIVSRHRGKCCKGGHKRSINLPDALDVIPVSHRNCKEIYIFAFVFGHRFLTELLLILSRARHTLCFCLRFRKLSRTFGSLHHRYIVKGKLASWCFLFCLDVAISNCLLCLLCGFLCGATPRLVRAYVLGWGASTRLVLETS